MNEELIAKARQADSPEEIMKIAEENDIEMCKEEAESIYKQLHTSGEMSDDELEGVAGGCSKDGKTIVTSGCKCFNGQFREFRRGDSWDLFSSDGCCGRCWYLYIEKGIGHCSYGH